jgi:hypothetical protein
VARPTAEAPAETDVPLLAWDLGPYRMRFTARAGGVSTGPYESLNLGWLTDDRHENVLANRRRLARACGLAPESVTMMWQRHGTDVWVAEDTGPHLAFADPANHENRPGDGCATAERGRALVALGADCLPVLLVATSGDRAACAAVHAGWRGLLAGVIERAAAVLADRFGAERLTAAIGPGAGGCCYEVSEEIAGAARDRFGADVTAGGSRMLDLPLAAERALEAGGADAVRRLGACTIHDGRFFSHRASGGVTGRQAGVVWIAP